MIASKKRIIKKIVKGFIMAAIIYVSLSMIATSIIYNIVFQRYTPEKTADIQPLDVQIAQHIETYSYGCDDHNLKGFLYRRESEKNSLVVLSPGFKAEIAEYEGLINSLLCRKFDVFAFDATGHGKSGGDSSIGFPQIIKDLSATLEFIDSRKNDFNYNNIFLLGHSRGGYAACCVMNDYDSVTAVVSVNGVDTAMDAIMAYSTDYLGDIAYGNYPFLALYQTVIFGNELADKSAVEEINSTKKPVFIIQSSKDEQIPIDNYSIYSKRKRIKNRYAKILLYEKENYNGHTTILLNEKKEVNEDIVEIISEFFESNL